MKKTAHPYHYWEDKNLMQRVLDVGVPAGLFFLFFFFYNFGKFTPPQMIKTSGLLSISLLSLTLLVGPLCKVFPVLNFLKAHRKFWGITSFLAALLHLILVFVFYYNFSISPLIDFGNTDYLKVLLGLMALAILLLVTLTSNQKALTYLSPEVWKFIQTTSYIALFLAFAHFFLMESVDGVLTIKRLLGNITFWFAGFVLVFRILIMFLPANRR